MVIDIDTLTHYDAIQSHHIACPHYPLFILHVEKKFADHIMCMPFDGWMLFTWVFFVSFGSIQEIEIQCLLLNSIFKWFQIYFQYLVQYDHWNEIIAIQKKNCHICLKTIFYCYANKYYTIFADCLCQMLFDEYLKLWTDCKHIETMHTTCFTTYDFIHKPTCFNWYIVRWIHIQIYSTHTPYYT